jgi:hypothetical protein
MHPVTNRQIAVGLGAFVALMAGLSGVVWTVGALMRLLLT